MVDVMNGGSPSLAGLTVTMHATTPDRERLQGRGLGDGQEACPDGGRFCRVDHGLLESVAVRPNAVGRGIGKRLIKYCEAEAKRSNAKSIKLCTNEKMTENLSIYPHFGYRETDRKTEDGFNRVVFEKRVQTRVAGARRKAGLAGRST